MRTDTVQSFEELSRAAADRMIEAVAGNPAANLCLASGGSPELAYRLFVEGVRARGIDTTRMMVTKLDEWCGFSAEHESSCERYLQERIVAPLSIPPCRYISFRPDAEDYEQEVRRVREQLREHPIDLCVLGFGRNGHLGLNEPGDWLYPRAHVAQIAPATKLHPLLKSNRVEQGMTIGMGDIFAAREVLFLVTGAGKQEVYEQWMTEEITTRCPASLLWLHPSAVALVDQSSFKPKE